MQAMAWWSVPLAAFILAIVWVSVANRPRPPADPHDSVAEHQRFGEAMKRSVARPPRDGLNTPDPDGDADRSGADPPA
jgi:hypothetical protein